MTPDQLTPEERAELDAFDAEFRAIQTRDYGLLPETYTRFPRTLDEAFRTARYADPIHRPPRDYPPAWWACLWLAAVAACALAWVTR